MPKILSQSGMSLADQYDIEGSVAGVDELVSEEVHLVHEMGAVMFSERFGAEMRRSHADAMLQSVTFDIVTTDFARTTIRILGVVVLTDNPARLQNCMVAIRDGTSGSEREMPIFAWDTNEASLDIRVQEDGAAVGSLSFLQNALDIGVLPSMLVGASQPRFVDQIAFRGQTTAFGAGTVDATMLLYIAFAEMGGLSSVGLPVPGW